MLTDRSDAGSCKGDACGCEEDARGGKACLKLQGGCSGRHDRCSVLQGMLARDARGHRRMRGGAGGGEEVRGAGAAGGCRGGAAGCPSRLQYKPAGRGRGAAFSGAPPAAETPPARSHGEGAAVGGRLGGSGAVGADAARGAGGGLVQARRQPPVPHGGTRLGAADGRSPIPVPLAPGAAGRASAPPRRHRARRRPAAPGEPRGGPSAAAARPRPPPAAPAPPGLGLGGAASCPRPAAALRPRSSGKAGNRRGERPPGCRRGARGAGSAFRSFGIAGREELPASISLPSARRHRAVWSEGTPRDSPAPEGGGGFHTRRRVGAIV